MYAGINKQFFNADNWEPTEWSLWFAHLYQESICSIFYCWNCFDWFASLDFWNEFSTFSGYKITIFIIITLRLSANLNSILHFTAIVWGPEHSRCLYKSLLCWSGSNPFNLTVDASSTSHLQYFGMVKFYQGKVQNLAKLHPTIFCVRKLHADHGHWTSSVMQWQWYQCSHIGEMNSGMLYTVIPHL